MSSLHRFNSGVRRYPFSTRKADLAGRSALQGRNRGRLGSAVDQPARNRLVPGDVVFVVTGVDRVARPGRGVGILRVAVHEIEQLLILEPGRDLLGFQPGARAARQVFDPAGHNGHRCQTKPDRSIGQNHPIHCHCARPFDQIQPGAVLQTLPSFRPARDSRPASFDLDSAAGRSRFRQILGILGDARRTRKVSVLKETRERDQNRHPFHRPGGASGSLVSCLLWCRPCQETREQDQGRHQSRQPGGAFGISCLFRCRPRRKRANRTGASTMYRRPGGAFGSRIGDYSPPPREWT